MGMILKTMRFLSSAASGLVVLVMNLMNPCMMNEALVSPGWTLEHTMMYFLYLLRGAELWLVWYADGKFAV